MTLRNSLVRLAGINLCFAFTINVTATGAETMAGWASDAFLAPGSNSVPADNTGSSPWLISGRPPFSFTYGGKSSDDFLATWNPLPGAASETPASTKRTMRWTDPDTGLCVIAETTVFKDFPAVEWVLRFENTGPKDTPILENVQALDLKLGTNPPERALELHQIAGSSANDTDYVPSEKAIAPGSVETFAPREGMSSAGAFPFFTLCFGRENLITAVGWTGQWEASIKRDSSGPARVRAGMEFTHLKLHPGESIRTPRILILLHNGDRIDAQNLFRRLIIAHYAPRIDGQLPAAAIGGQSFNLTYLAHYGPIVDGQMPQLTVGDQNFNLARLRQIAKLWDSEAGQILAARVNQRVGADTLWMDAGWFSGFHVSGAGNWVPNPEDYPRGLKPVGDACHQLGLRFLLWYEPERAQSGTWVATEHPEWLLDVKTGGRSDWKKFWAEPGEHTNGLFNLGDPKARQWMTDLLDRQIDEFGLDCYRQDFNMNTLPFWRANDAPDRQGITEIRHIEGLYAMWDEMRAKHPKLYLDDCAGGGRRIDLEMISRAIVQTRSDSEGVPGRADWEQSQTYGLSLYYPLSSSFTWDLTPYDFRSYAGRGLCGEWDVLSPEFPVDLVKAAFAEVKANRPYFTGDYYPLTPWTMADDRWMAYQFHRADLDAGIVLAFRHLHSPQTRLRATLRGLKPDATYVVTFIGDDYKESERVMGGNVLADLELHLEKPHSSLLVRYRLQAGQ